MTKADYIRYTKKYQLPHSDHLIQVFQSFPWPQVYTIMHLGMQTASTHIPTWYHDRIPPVQQVQSWNFLATKYSNIPQLEVLKQNDFSSAP